MRVLGKHRYEITDPVVSGEASEQGDADVHHALGFRDHDRAPPKPGEPMPLAGVVPLDAMRLLLARVDHPCPWRTARLAEARHRRRNQAGVVPLDAMRLLLARVDHPC